MATLRLLVGASVVALLSSSCSEPSPNGTARMVARLDSLATFVDRNHVLYHSDTRVRDVRAMQPPSDLLGYLQYEVGLAAELLNAGQTDAAVETYDSVRVLARKYRNQIPPEPVRIEAELLAASRLRRNYLEKCVATHDARPCTLGIEGSGDDREGDLRAAIGIYEQILAEAPEDLRSRWLMNLAYMGLGRYPAGVPPKYRIPPSAFRSQHDIGAFRDVAPALGVDVLGRAGAAILDDFDRDGWLDILATSWGVRDPMSYFHNNGDGTFTDRTQAAGLEGITGGLQAVQADYDNDGFLDVLVLRGAWLPLGMPNSLLHNRGDGTFEDVTEHAGLLAAHPTQTAAWGDFDNDGFLDLFIGNESTPGENTSPAQLFHNNRNGTFTDVATKAGVAVVGFTKGVTAGDYDNDGRLDLYVSRLGQPNILFHNDGADREGTPHFTDVTATAGVSEPVNSFPTWFFDYDNDGFLDLFVSGYWTEPDEVAREYLGLPLESGTPKLYRNLGNGTFADVTEQVGLERVLQTMGCNFGDLDNDGYLDFYVGTGDPDPRSVMPSRMFRNAGGSSFQEVTTATGFGILAKGHGVAFGDVDNDGDQDIYMTLGGAFRGDAFRNVLFANPGHGNHWITLRLEGVRSNRAAIGARIHIEVDTPEGPRSVYATVGSGGSFGASSLQQEIGLGDAVQLRSLEIWWPTSGRRDVVRDVTFDRIYAIREGASEPTPVVAPKFDLDALVPQGG